MSKPPRKQVVEPIDLVVGNTAKDIGEPGVRIDAVELGCLNQCVGNGGGSSCNLHEPRLNCLRDAR